ncbi:hypothetical protein HPP92_027062 [Vanilla planifolia]|uniref:Uncharacterized protein n=1 Tax=Vanilla planifolia TaxID=51239 RepID=A0A835PDG0_VANPL|nr:hypothetical protein HPP92_027062 [Vanilla planifolia]
MPRSKPEEGDVECRRLGLGVVSGLADDLRNVRISASLDSGALGVAVMKLAGGIGKVREVFRLNEALNPNEKNVRFHDSMLEFLKKAEVVLMELQAQEVLQSPWLRDN